MRGLDEAAHLVEVDDSVLVDTRYGEQLFSSCRRQLLRIKVQHDLTCALKCQLEHAVYELDEVLELDGQRAGLWILQVHILHLL